jgi:hypothetical protein
MADPDDDLHSMSPQQLTEEVKRLRAGIRAHRDSTGHELCWFHPQLWTLLPETTKRWWCRIGRNSCAAASNSASHLTAICPTCRAPARNSRAKFLSGAQLC